MEPDRRSFLATAAGATAAGATAGFGLLGLASCATAGATASDGGGASTTSRPAAPLFRLSLAEWSLHRALGHGGPATMTNLDFAREAATLGFAGIEYVNRFLEDRAQDRAYLAALNQAARDHGVQQLLIMCDGEGQLGHPDAARRAQAVENHYRWVEAARVLGCHSIRVNAASRGTPGEQTALAADGLRRLTEFGAEHEINVLVENHGGLSSNGAWLAGVIRRVDHPRCGTLPDFGNFDLGGGKAYDRYDGVRELMPFAKAVSAKSHDFDAGGNETHTDYVRMMRIVLDAGYRGFVGVEYEGRTAPERAGILATRALLERVREQAVREKWV